MTIVPQATLRYLSGSPTMKLLSWQQAQWSTSGDPGERLDQKEKLVSQPEWDWALTPSDDKHADRFPMMRAIEYEMISQTGPEAFKTSFASREGKALTLNISSAGMLLLMDQAPRVAEVLKVYVPTPITQARTPTLAEVAWTRPVPLAPDRLQFVGLKFVI